MVLLHWLVAARKFVCPNFRRASLALGTAHPPSPPLRLARMPTGSPILIEGHLCGDTVIFWGEGGICTPCSPVVSPLTTNHFFFKPLFVTLSPNYEYHRLLLSDIALLHKNIGTWWYQPLLIIRECKTLRFSMYLYGGEPPPKWLRDTRWSSCWDTKTRGCGWEFGVVNSSGKMLMNIFQNIYSSIETHVWIVGCPPLQSKDPLSY